MHLSGVFGKILTVWSGIRVALEGLNDAAVSLKVVDVPVPKGTRAIYDFGVTFVLRRTRTFS